MMKSCVLKPLLHELRGLIGAGNARYLTDGALSTIYCAFRAGHVVYCRRTLPDGQCGVYDGAGDQVYRPYYAGFLPDTKIRCQNVSLEKTGGTEIVVLDCIGFLRHFLHFFHRSRAKFLDSYQNLVLSEPDSAVSQPLKEALLALRQAAEADRE